MAFEIQVFPLILLRVCVSCFLYRLGGLDQCDWETFRERKVTLRILSIEMDFRLSKQTQVLK